jgi:hypothetical protein
VFSWLLEELRAFSSSIRGVDSYSERIFGKNINLGLDVFSSLYGIFRHVPKIGALGGKENVRFFNPKHYNVTESAFRQGNRYFLAVGIGSDGLVGLDSYRGN